MEVLNFPFPFDNKGKRRYLYPADTPHTCSSMLPGTNGVSPRQVDANQPVGTLPCQPCMVERLVFLIRFYMVECPLQTVGVLGIDKNTAHLSLVADILQNLVNKKLAFPVRVAAIDHHIRFP